MFAFVEKVYKNIDLGIHFGIILEAFWHYFSLLFAEMCAPPSVGSIYFKNDSKQSAFKNNSFESFRGALALSIPLRRALFRQ